MDLCSTEWMHKNTLKWKEQCGYFVPLPIIGFLSIR